MCRFDDFLRILPKGETRKKIIYVIALTVGFIVIIRFAGFIVSGALFLLLQFHVNYNWRVSIIGSVVGTLVIYLIFSVLLKVDLPVNVLGF